MEWDEWQHHQVTKEWYSFLEFLKKELQDDWANSVFTGSLEGETVQRNAFALGQVELLSRLLEISSEEILEMYSGRDDE